MSVGGAPIIFITNRQGALANVTDATESSIAAGVLWREVLWKRLCRRWRWRYPGLPARTSFGDDEHHRIHSVPVSRLFGYPDFSGNSQETGVAGHNPLNGLACGTGGPKPGRSVSKDTVVSVLAWTGELGPASVKECKAATCVPSPTSN